MWKNSKNVYPSDSVGSRGYGLIYGHIVGMIMVTKYYKNVIIDLARVKWGLGDGVDTFFEP